MVEAVIFDCFGTLVELEPSAYFTKQRIQAFRLLNERVKDLTYDSFRAVWTGTFAAMEAESRITQNEFSMAEFVAKVQKKLGTDIDNELVVDTYLQEWVFGLRAIDGLVESLDRIRQDKKIAIISNTHYAELIPRALSIASIDPAIFDTIVTSVEVGKQKPHPAMMEKVLSDLSVRPTNAVMVGDSYHDDFGIAKAAGTRCILVGAEHTLDNSFEPGHYIPINNILDVEKRLFALTP